MQPPTTSVPSAQAPPASAMAPVEFSQVGSVYRTARAKLISLPDVDPLKCNPTPTTTGQSRNCSCEGGNAEGEVQSSHRPRR